MPDVSKATLTWLVPVGQMMLPVAVCPPGIREVNRRLGMQCAGQTHDHLIFFCSRVLAPGSSFCVGRPWAWARDM